MTSYCQIIGICGHKSNGKDTIADYLVKNYCYTKVSFGDTLKKAIQEIFGFSDQQLWGNEKETVDKFWKLSPRSALQYIGTDCMRNQFGSAFPNIGDNIWVMALRCKIDKLLSSGVSRIVIPDVRFPNEETMIRLFNGIILRVNRNSVVSSDNHISENLIDKIHIDYCVENNTFQQLYRDVDKIMLTIHTQYGECSE